MIPRKDPLHAYIGETGRHLRSRLAEHRQDVDDIWEKKRECMNSIDQTTRTRSTIHQREQTVASANDILRQCAKPTLAAHAKGT